MFVRLSENLKRLSLLQLVRDCFFLKCEVLLTVLGNILSVFYMSITGPNKAISIFVAYVGDKFRESGYSSTTFLKCLVFDQSVLIIVNNCI